MKQTKRVISIMLCLLMLVAVVPVMEMRAISQSDFDAKVSSFKSSKYANNSTYVNNSSYGGYQCFGFANELASWIFDSFPTSSMSAYTVNTNWTRTYGGNAVDSLALGDIVRYKYHSIFITGISGDTIYYAQANVPSGTNKVTYDNSVSRSSLKSLVNAQLTHDGANTTGWVAHCNNGVETTHTHSYKEGYEGAHPHRYYMKCSCGDWYYTGKTAKMTSGYEAVHPHRCYETCSICNENFLTGTTTTVASCLECNRPSKPSVNNLKSTYCFTQKVTLTWTATTNTTHYNVVIQKKSNGNWIVCKRTNYASSDISYQLDAGDYRVQLQSYNSNKWENDGSDWLHTLSSWQYFTVINHAYNTGTVTKAATCVTTGTKTYACTVCNATKTETIAINASNHVNTKNIAATASTCTVKGYTAGVYCNDCKKYISGHAEQPLAAHQTATQNAKAATCTAAGYTGDQVCTVCKQTITKGTAIAKKAHTLTTVNQKAAGCTTAGYTGDQYCTTCKQTITKGSTIAALGHANADSNGNCTRCGQHIKDVTPSQPSNPQPNPNACKYCGKVHTGPFGWLIKFFHSILAIFKR